MYVCNLKKNRQSTVERGAGEKKAMEKKWKYVKWYVTLPSGDHQKEFYFV